MNSLTIKKNNKEIRLYSSSSIIEKEKDIIDNLNLTGYEAEDRLIIQQCIDNNNLKSNILYDGNTVYSFNKIVKLYKKLQKEGNLNSMNKEMYHFFMNACGDIAYYDMGGYICNYNNSIINLEETFLKDCKINSRFTDVDRIFKELKIGKYYKDRKTIDLNKLSLNKLKRIIKDCNWNIVEKENNLWQLYTKIDDKLNFTFDAEVGNDISTVIYSLIRYSINFNADEYIELIAKERTPDLSLRSIVNYSDAIKRKLMNFASELLYKSRIEADMIKDNKSISNDYDLVLER